MYALTSGSLGPATSAGCPGTAATVLVRSRPACARRTIPPFALPAQFPGDPGKTNASAVRACLQ